MDRAVAQPARRRYQGHDQLLEYFGKVARLSGGTYGGDVLDVMDGAGRAAALVASHGTRGGRTLAETYVLVAEVRDGRIVRGALYPEDGARFDAFWA
jgi:ketosteroid isomerase-like protein